MRLRWLTFLVVLGLFVPWLLTHSGAAPNPMLWILRVRNQVPEYRIALAINPNPPTCDDTIVFRAHVSDSDGHPVELAQVELQAFVPGGQLAMRRVPMRALGKGDYEARTQLAEAAEWAVDVVAEKGWHSARQRHTVSVQPAMMDRPGNGGDNDSDDDE